MLSLMQSVMTELESEASRALSYQGNSFINAISNICAIGYLFLSSTHPFCPSRRSAFCMPIRQNSLAVARCSLLWPVVLDGGPEYHFFTFLIDWHNGVVLGCSVSHAVLSCDKNVFFLCIVCLLYGNNVLSQWK